MAPPPLAPSIPPTHHPPPPLLPSPPSLDPSFPPLARLETGIRFRPSLALPRPTGRFRVHTQLATSIACWRMVPGFDDAYLHAAFAHTEGLKAVVLELYGE